MRRRFACALTAVTMTVTALSVLASPLTEGVARADGAPAPAPVVVQVAPAAPPAAPPAAIAATPLNLVPSKPLELAEPAPSSNLGWKLGAMAVLAAAGFWAYTKKKNATPAIQASIPEMRILRRTSIGVRSELLLVDLEGQRILLGVTPSNIQSLLIVPDSAMSDPIPVEEPASSRDSVAALRGMPSMAQLMKQLDDDEGRNDRNDRSESVRIERPRESVRATERATAEQRTRVTKRAPAKRRRPEDEIEEDTAAPVEGQAEGLMAYRRGGRGA